MHVASDGRYLYVRFDATQRGPAIASQHSNDTISGGSQGNGGSLSWSSDDAVWVDLWPTGPTGFEYQFEANPNGSHNESSTENAAFAPQWESHGAIHDGGYTVTMAIPLNVIHGARTGAWRAQFIRYVHATGAEYVWSYDAAQTKPDDVSRAGSLAVTVSGKAPLPPPRAALYALGSVASASAGGSTSRIGGDLSVPVTPTAALFATFHPDYSNVELDQQTIAPTVYQRQIAEVRPFFTQAASYYNNFNCDVCSGYVATLYTPAIPTFGQGYAFEGKQGNFGFAGFDAIANGRSDLATALDYNSPDTRWQAAFQHVSTNLTGFVDDTNEIGGAWNDHNHLSAYAHYATEYGTNVLVPSSCDLGRCGRGLPKPAFCVLRFDSRRRHSIQSGRRVRVAPRDRRLRPLQRAHLDVRAAKRDRVDGDQRRARPLSGPVYGQSQSDNQLLVRRPHEERVGSAALYRVRLLALRQPARADLAERRLQPDLP